jgi:hypothetical protein
MGKKNFITSGKTILKSTNLFLFFFSLTVKKFYISVSSLNFFSLTIFFLNTFIIFIIFYSDLEFKFIKKCFLKKY